MPSSIAKSSLSCLSFLFFGLFQSEHFALFPHLTSEQASSPSAEYSGMGMYTLAQIRASHQLVVNRPGSMKHAFQKDVKEHHGLETSPFLLHHAI
jgi:hypothetical protein